MTCTNRYGQYTDIPVDKAWYLKFDTLALPEDHRKILNRQPVIHFIKLPTGAILIFMPLNVKVMSN
jgi:hypothetical protein